jgi:cytochrome c-type biogenesis protein CcmH
MAFIALCLLAGSGALYWQLGNPDYPDQALSDRIALAGEFLENRPSQAAAEESLSRSDLPRVENPSPDYVALVAQLRNVVANRPNDIEGLRLLAISERKLGNFSAAHTAFGRHIELRGGDVSSGEWSDLADMMILAANGYVSPEAQVALQSALALDPANPPARYYWGQMMSQTGRPDIAFRTWDALLREGPADAPWIPPIMAQIDEMAMRAGEMGYTPPQIGVAGPSAADIEAAEDMSASERMEMIEGMVSGLSDTLASEGGPPEKWAQLITALGVLGRTNQAAAVFANATEVFGADPLAMDLINRAGERAGVSN